MQKIVIRGKTYPIKDELKSHGFRWDGLTWSKLDATPDDVEYAKSKASRTIQVKIGDKWQPCPAPTYNTLDDIPMIDALLGPNALSVGQGPHRIAIIYRQGNAIYLQYSYGPKQGQTCAISLQQIRDFLAHKIELTPTRVWLP